VYTEYTRTGERKNLLDLEDTLTNVADHVLIILEGYGAYCELGAFSHTELRSKILVINDRRYATSPSFISLGPLTAISEAQSGAGLISYPMDDQGRDFRDRIGDTFVEIDAALRARSSAVPTRLGHDDLNPEAAPNKTHLFFIHDLIYLLGGASNAILVRTLTALFGSRDYRQHKKLLATLITLQLITKDEHDVYHSTKTTTILDFNNDEIDIAISLRVYSLKSGRRQP